MATTAVAQRGQPKRRDANQWVIPIVIAAWAIVLLCGLLVGGLA